MSKYSNNIKSRYFIINLEFKQLKNIYKFKDFNNLIIDWIDISLLKNFNSTLNWNIGIYYPDEFYLTNNVISNLNKESLLERLIVNIFIYLDNTYYPNINESLIYYNNTNTTLYDELHPQDLLDNLDINNFLFQYDYDTNIINKISISGVDYYSFYNLLNPILIGDLFYNSYINDINFIYLKNIKLNTSYKFIQPIDKINHFIYNFIYNTKNEFN